MSFLKILLVVSWCGIAYANIAMFKEKQRKGLLVDSVEVCDKRVKSLARLNYMRLEYLENVGTNANANGTILRDLDSDKLHLELDIKRCRSRESLDTCERYALLKPTNLCEFLDLPGLAWVDVLHNVRPPLVCPFRKGDYVGHDLSINPNLFTMFPLEGFYWKVRSTMYEGQTHVFSLCLDARVVSLNGRQKN